MTQDAAPIKKPRIYVMPFVRIHDAYINKAERKGRTKAEVDRIITWYTGYDESGLAEQLAAETDVETFYADAPAMNPARSLITGMICGIRVETIDDPTMRAIRELDKLIDELANGRPMQKILRTLG